MLLFNKPKDWTSFDVVNKVRWLIKTHLKNNAVPNSQSSIRSPKLKVGHAGTLDPLATGLLILCTGKMTKQIDEFQAQQKEYTGTIQLGGTTASYDSETPVLQEFKTSHINENMVFEAAKYFTGAISQIPPAFSALKVDGKRAYVSARKGEVVELKTREVTILQFEIINTDLENKKTVDFRVVCSKGTFIRSLANDFGKYLNSGAFLSSLCRTKIGDFDLKDAWELTDFEKHIQSLPSKK